MKYEYIKFRITKLAEYEAFARVYKLLYSSKETIVDWDIEFVLSDIPSSVKLYFSELEKINSWNLKNIVSFIVEELDIQFQGLTRSHELIGKLEFEAGGYPYGGPAALIYLLYGFKLIPFEVDEGADIYQINWISKFEFNFESRKNLDREINTKPKSPICSWLKSIISLKEN